MVTGKGVGMSFIHVARTGFRLETSHSFFIGKLWAQRLAFIALFVAWAALVAGSPSKADDTRAPQSSEGIMATAVLAWGQSFPLPAKQAAWWTIHQKVNLVFPRSLVGKDVTVRTQQDNGQADDMAYSFTVQPGGNPVAGGGYTSFSLSAAEASLIRFSTPMTITITSTWLTDPVVISVTEWDIKQRLVFKDVRMKRTGKTFTFSGRLLTATGQAAQGFRVVACQFKDYSFAALSGDQPLPDQSGRFRVQVTGAKKGSIGLSTWDTGENPSGTQAFSQLFRVK